MKGKFFTYYVALLGWVLLQPSLSSQAPVTRVVKGRTFLVHKVGPKETMYGISRKYQVPVDTLYALNPGATLVIRPDQEILIPAPKSGNVPVSASSPEVPNGATHVVTAGETLYGLARKYKTTESELRRLNPAVGDYLKVGEVLILPKAGDQTHVVPPVVSPERDRPTAPSTTPKPTVQPTAPQATKPVQEQVGIKDCGENFAWERPIRVALLLPFPEGNEGEIKLATEFYAGFKIAADAISDLGVAVHVSVWNTGGSQDVSPTKQLIREGKLDQADLIVGPLYPTALSQVSVFAQEKGIPVVTPFSRSASLMDAAKGVIKLTPSRAWVIERTIKYFQRTYPQSHFILVDGQSKKDSLLVAHYKTQLELLGVGKFVKTTPGGVSAQLKQGQRNIIFFPTTREIAAKDLMMKLNGMRNSHTITLVGTEEWLEFSTVEVDYYEHLQLHLPVAYQFHPEDSTLLDFRKKFRDQFGGEPGLAAHRGYETGMYFLYHLKQTGTAFPLCALHGLPVLGPKFFQFAGNKMDGFENQSCRMMVFRDYQYLLVIF